MFSRFDYRFLFLVAVYFHYPSLAHASERIKGCFVAKEACEAFRSIKKKSNPGNVRLSEFELYEVIAKNKQKPSYYQLNLSGIDSPQRWINKECGNYISNCRLLQSDDIVIPAELTTSVQSGELKKQPQYLLALSWEPTFCETHASKIECQTLTADRYDASHLSLHGLWPQPRSNAYCGVSSTDKAIDRRKKWHLLDKLPLSTATIEALKITMPGYASNLQRHEWIKHGTCYGKSADQYYRDAIALTQEINRSTLGQLLTDSIGEKVHKAQIDAAFEEDYGEGSATKISMRCDRKGRLAEIWINLAGELSETAMTDLLAPASKAGKGNCTSGVVDVAN